MHNNPEKLKNLESELLHYTGNQILRKLKNSLREPLQHTCILVLKKVKNLESGLMHYTENQILKRLWNHLKTRSEFIIRKSSKYSKKEVY